MLSLADTHNAHSWPFTYTVPLPHTQDLQLHPTSDELTANLYCNTRISGAHTSCCGDRTPAQDSRSHPGFSMTDTGFKDHSWVFPTPSNILSNEKNLQYITGAIKYSSSPQGFPLVHYTAPRTLAVVVIVVIVLLYLSCLPFLLTVILSSEHLLMYIEATNAAIGKYSYIPCWYEHFPRVIPTYSSQL